MSEDLNLLLSITFRHRRIGHPIFSSDFEFPTSARGASGFSCGLLMLVVRYSRYFTAGYTALISPVFWGCGIWLWVM